MLKAIHLQEDKEAVGQQTEQVTVKLRALRPDKAAHIVEAGAEEIFLSTNFPEITGGIYAGTILLKGLIVKSEVYMGGRKFL